MNRRVFVTSAVLAACAGPISASAEEVAYKPGLVQQRLAKGETLLVDFFAPWCGTCMAQRRVMDELKAANPAYEASITFVTVDWDTYENDKLTKDLNIPRRSTLVVLKGEKELGRTVAGTGKAEIKALLDAALGAASS